MLKNRPQTQATSAQVQAARERHQMTSDEIEIEADAEVVRADLGYWVRAWVYVPNGLRAQEIDARESAVNADKD